MSQKRPDPHHYMDIPSLGPLETVGCMLCGGAETATVTTQHWFGEEFHVVRCVRCHLMFTNPRPSPQWKTHYYDPRYNPLMEDLNREFLYLPMQDRILAFRHLLQFIKNHLGPGGTLLDVGCAGGQFVHMAREQGFAATGLDPSPGALAYASEHYGLKLILGEAEHMPVPDHTYDVVTLLHVLEHFRNPLDVLREIRRILKPGGTLFVETPNCLRFYLLERYLPVLKWAFLRLPHRLGSAGTREIPWYPFDHYYHWTRGTLMTALRRSGFEKCRTYIVDNFASSMPAQGAFPFYHKMYMHLVKSLYAISRQRLNVWGLLIATCTAP